MLKAAILVALVVALSALLPVEVLVSDAMRPPPDKVLTPQGVAQVAPNPLWLYTWRATVMSTLLLFAAIVATFFLKTNERARWTLAFLSLLTAALHYITLVLTSNPPGYGISIYPLTYIISVKDIQQIYLDFGQILILYAIYNIYKIKLS